MRKFRAWCEVVIGVGIIAVMAITGDWMLKGVIVAPLVAAWGVFELVRIHYSEKAVR